jgi:predicted small secreted protein
MSRKPILLMLTVLALVGAASLLMSACNTMAGAGQDVTSAGHVITGDARQATPR